jgi:hypothetical protein
MIIATWRGTFAVCSNAAAGFTSFIAGALQAEAASPVRRDGRRIALIPA